MQKSRIKTATKYVLLTLYLCITGYPIVWMCISSFKSNSEYYANPWGFPKVWQFENFAKAWHMGIQDYLVNSLIITVATVLVVLALSSMLAFFVARRPFKGSQLILSLFLAGMLIPVHSTLIPIFIIEKNLGILNSFFGLLFPYIAFSLPVAIFLLHGYYVQVPFELEEAGIIDGCSLLQIYRKIFVPLSKPVFATVAILTALGAWNEFIYALVLISKESLKTLPIGLMSFKGMFTVDYAVMSAALVISAAPIIVLYISMSERITQGMIAGAVKG